MCWFAWLASIKESRTPSMVALRSPMAESSSRCLTSLIRWLDPDGVLLPVDEVVRDLSPRALHSSLVGMLPRTSSSSTTSG